MEYYVGPAELEHYEACVVGVNDEWWGVVMGVGSVVEAEKLARKKLALRVEQESGYEPAWIVIFRCVSVVRISVRRA